MQRARPCTAALAAALLLVGCGQITVQAPVDVVVDVPVVQPDVPPDVAVGPDVDAAPGTDIQVDTTSVDEVNSDAPGTDCETDFDCSDQIKGKTPCILPACDNGHCVKKQKATGDPCVDPQQPTGECNATTCSATGQCVLQNKPDKVGDVITVCGIGVCGKKCADGQCVPATDADYEDGNPCTKDVCNQGIEIQHLPITDFTLTCDDKNACTGGDVCLAGECHGKPMDCSDGVPCTLDTCDPATGCIHSGDSTKCNDGDPCTKDACDLAVGCTVDGAVPGAACNDKNKCTENDVCAADGTCSGASTCMCQQNSDCVSANKCLGQQLCVKNVCVIDPAAAVKCDPTFDTFCLQETCEPETGVCSPKPVHDGDPCEDGNACTATTKCSAGMCLGPADVVCDDKNPCTSDACDAITGCSFTPNTLTCDDGNQCTQGDVCAKGACNGTAINCADDLACTLDGCETATGTCTHTGNAAACDDGNPCTTDSCDTTTGCKHGADDTGKCDDGNACTVDTCDPTLGCLHAEPAGLCDDKNSCTNDSCTPSSGCVHTSVQDGTSCVDSDLCTINETCTLGTCSGLQRTCADGELCTTDSCDPATGCVYAANSFQCNDGNACTIGDACLGGTCQPGAPMNCADTVNCTDDVCDLGTCTHTLVDSNCNDATVCTTDLCTLANDCVNTPVNCADGLSCTFDLCDAVLGCSNPPNTCNDGVACTADSCDATQGCLHVSSDALCNDGSVCTIDSCTGTTCVHQGVAGPCDDGDPCTVGDTCNAGKGTCAGANKCDDGNQCTVDSCDVSGGCLNVSAALDYVPCDDGSLCTNDEYCLAGKCAGGSAVNCEDNDACSYANCNPDTGLCAANPTNGYLALETFAYGARLGWDLQGQWQTGAALGSGGQTAGNPDPSVDGSLTPGGWLVGTVIGGNLSTTATNGYVYLTSPLYDFGNLTSQPSMTLSVDTDAFLNLDASSQALRVEYSTDLGANWTTLLDYTNVAWNAWGALHIGNVTITTSTQSLQFRFGYKVISVAGQPTTSGISLDNFRLTCTTCSCGPL